MGCLFQVLLLGFLLGGRTLGVAEVSATEMNIGGTWRFALDPHDVGKEENWQNLELPSQIQLPGSVVGNGFGDPITVDTRFRGHIFHEWYDSPRYAPYRKADNIKIPSFLQPPKHYVGPAWYARTIYIPENWKGKRIFLSLERCQFESEAWLDGTYLGKQESLSVPHIYALGQVSPGEHRIALRIDNRCHIDVGVAHAVNDWIQTNWNGAIGRIELQAKDPIYIDNVQVYPNAARRTLAALVKIINDTGKQQSCEAEFLSESDSEKVLERTRRHISLNPGETIVEIEQKFASEVKTWDEFSPNLHQFVVKLTAADWKDECACPFAFRDLTIEGSRFVLNGKPIMLRGTHEAGLFPLTGYPAMDLASWRRILTRCKEFGLNHMRFHSWCPPEAAFQAADELGIYFQIEGPFNCVLGDGKPVDRYLREELDRILQVYGNHPSFMLMAHGNEPGGENKDKLLAREVTHWKQTDPRHLYTAGSGWPMLNENDYHCNHSPRLQLWGEGLQSRINSNPPNTANDFSDLYKTYDRPMVIHESGQWCVYPNFEEMSKYTGVLKPRNFEIFRDFLEQNHMGDLAQSFLMASGRLQMLCYKEEIEHALRTPGCAGFQLLDIHDYSGQGTALVGILDPFWDPKPYVSREEWRKFCGPTVPLARMSKRVWTTDEELTANVEVTHFGPNPMADAYIVYLLQDDHGNIIAKDLVGLCAIPIGNSGTLGEIRIPLHSFAAPARYKLTLLLEGTPERNDWDFWVYPNNVNTEVPADVLLVRTLDEQALQHLQHGGKVLVAVNPRQVSSPVKIGFSSMFWNVSFTGNQAPHTLGLLCDPKHPVFNSFPTEFFSNWQWWWPIRKSVALVVDSLPPTLRPLIQPIDNWFYARRLSLLFEAKVAGGSVMVCSIDIVDDIESHPEIRQLRRSIFDYMASGEFHPEVEITWDSLKELLKTASRESTLKKLGTTICEVSAETTSAPASNLIDGSIDTIWVSNRQYDPPYPPHFVVFDMKQAVNIAGIIYMPRQDVSGGRVGDYKIFVSNDGNTWGDPVVSGKWEDSMEEQRVLFDYPRKARFLKILAENEVHSWSYVSMAEIDIITDWRQ